MPDIKSPFLSLEEIDAVLDGLAARRPANVDELTRLARRLGIELRECHAALHDALSRVQHLAGLLSEGMRLMIECDTDNVRLVARIADLEAAARERETSR